jgi:hypothetical protein
VRRLVTASSVVTSTNATTFEINGRVYQRATLAKAATRRRTRLIQHVYWQKICP